MRRPWSTGGGCAKKTKEKNKQNVVQTQASTRNILIVSILGKLFT
jgi:hypothetical protein